MAYYSVLPGFNDLRIDRSNCFRALCENSEEMGEKRMSSRKARTMIAGLEIFGGVYLAAISLYLIPTLLNRVLGFDFFRYMEGTSFGATSNSTVTVTLSAFGGLTFLPFLLSAIVLILFLLSGGLFREARKTLKETEENKA